MRLPDPTHSLEATLFPGLLLLAGFVVFLVGRDRRRLPLASAALLTWILTLGPSLKVGGSFVVGARGRTGRHGCRTACCSRFPGFGVLRGPLRAGEVLVVLLTAGTAIALHRVLASRRVARGRVRGRLCRAPRAESPGPAADD